MHKKVQRECKRKDGWSKALVRVLGLCMYRKRGKVRNESELNFPLYLLHFEFKCFPQDIKKSRLYHCCHVFFLNYTFCLQACFAAHKLHAKTIPWGLTECLLKKYLFIWQHQVLVATHGMFPYRERASLSLQCESLPAPRHVGS